MAERRVPTVIVTSGGYTQQSHALVAELAQRVIERVGHGYAQPGGSAPGD